MVRDAYSLAKSGLDSAHVLLQPEIHYDSWNHTVAETAARLWGVDYSHDASRIQITCGKDMLHDIAYFYQLAVDNIPKKKSISLTCGDKQWKWVRTYKEAGISPPSGQQETSSIVTKWNHDPKKYGGAWYNKALGLGVAWEWDSLDKDGNPQYPGLCDYPFYKYGLTYNTDVIVICQAVWDDFPETLSEVRGDQGGYPKSTPLQDHLIPGGTLLHEYLHYIGHPHIIDKEYIDGSGQKVFGYDWEKCVDLASLFEAVENADNYMFFGMAMALKPVDWHRGKKMVT